MVKQNMKSIHKEIRIKLIKKGKSIAQFCRENGVSYSLYKALITGKVNGKRKKSKANRLVKAIEKLLNEDDVNIKVA